MKSSSQTDMPFSQMLLSWARHRIALAIAAIRPAYHADQIAAEVAASGNPSGT
jgi:hypothetical protein